MQWFYVQAGEQRGPVDEAELIRLRSTGEVKDTTLVWKDGMADWVPFTSVPIGLESMSGSSKGASEAGADAPEEVRPVVVAAIGGSTTSGSAARREKGQDPADLVPEDFQVEIGSCLARGWALLMGNFWPIVGVSLLIQVLYGCAQQIGVGALVLFVPLMSGLQYYYLVQIRGGRATLEDAFSGFKSSFGQLALMNLVGAAIVLASIIPGGILLMLGMMVSGSNGGGEGVVVGLLVVGGVVAALPALYFLVAWMFAGILAIDRGVDFWPAMMVSMRTVRKRFGACFVFVILLSFLSALGTLAFCVGILVSSPWVMIAATYLYEDVFGKSGRDRAV